MEKNRTILILTNITLFSFFINFLDNSIFTKAMTPFIVIITSLFACKRILKNRNIIFVVIIPILDFIISKSLRKRYYNNTYEFIDDIHLIFIFLAVLPVFILISKKIFKEFENSKNTFFIYSQIINLVNVYKFYFFFINIFKKIHAQGRISESLDNIEFNNKCFYFFIDFLILNIGFILRIVTKMLTSVNNKQKYLRSFINLYLLFIIATIFYYLNYNNVFLNYAYEFNNYHVPNPYNVVVYNSIPDADMRLKIMLVTMFSFFF